MSYTIEEHQHRFAAWAAGRAANVNGCRFKVEQGKQILEDVGLNIVARTINNLPQPNEFDAEHRKWRNDVINAAKKHNEKNGKPLAFTHGVAAKLINIYLKSIFVCSGSHGDPKVKAIHPPIDSVLLDALYRQNIGQNRNAWQSARNTRWSKLNSQQYENVINAIQHTIPAGSGLWRIEEYWQGFQ